MLRMHILMDKLPGDARTEVKDVLARAQDVMHEGRDRVQQLRSTAVRQGTLAQALAAAGEELAVATSVRFVVRDNAPRMRLDPETEDELFIIGREALSNAFRHAGATQVTLQPGDDAGTLRLTVSDDGAAIPPEILARGAREGHWACRACANGPLRGRRRRHRQRARDHDGVGHVAGRGGGGLTWSRYL